MSKLLEIQRRLVVLKSHFNQFGNYNYRSSEDILQALKPLLVETESKLTVADDIREIAGHVYIEARITLVNDEGTFAATSFARDPIEQKGMSAPQCTNSASSFAKKQALCNLFLIDDSAEVAPDKQELEEQKAEFEKREAQAAEEAQRATTEFLESAVKGITACDTFEQLKSVYAPLYRQAQRIDIKAVEALAGYYKTKKGELNETV